MVSNQNEMTLQPPESFDEVQREAVDNWDHVHGRDASAMPFDMLFEQVLSPRHVLSELLQNADDAGARIARVKFFESSFLFEHDGNDFTHSQFRALCSFAVSSKKHARTIGFRGIGFKSIFSLGDSVRLQLTCPR